MNQLIKSLQQVNFDIEDIVNNSVIITDEKERKRLGNKVSKLRLVKTYLHSLEHISEPITHIENNLKKLDQLIKSIEPYDGYKYQFSQYKDKAEYEALTGLAEYTKQRKFLTSIKVLLNDQVL